MIRQKQVRMRHLLNTQQKITSWFCIILGFVAISRSLRSCPRNSWKTSVADVHLTTDSERKDEFFYGTQLAVFHLLWPLLRLQSPYVVQLCSTALHIKASGRPAFLAFPVVCPQQKCTFHSVGLMGDQVTVYCNIFHVPHWLFQMQICSRCFQFTHRTDSFAALIVAKVTSDLNCKR